jgi:hypothetical protein
MHAAMLMIVVLAGLGSDNRCVIPNDGLSVYSAELSPYNNPYPSLNTPSSYSGYYSRPGQYESPDYMSHAGVIHSTLWSFLLGRDRDVATAAEIEASVYGNN